MSTGVWSHHSPIGALPFLSVQALRASKRGSGVRVAALAGAISLAAHLSAMAAFAPGGEGVQIAGGSGSGPAALGNSFADFVAGGIPMQPSNGPETADPLAPPTSDPVDLSEMVAPLPLDDMIEPVPMEPVTSTQPASTAETPPAETPPATAPTASIATAVPTATAVAAPLASVSVSDPPANEPVSFSQIGTAVPVEAAEAPPPEAAAVAPPETLAPVPEPEVEVQTATAASPRPARRPDPNAPAPTPQRAQPQPQRAAAPQTQTQSNQQGTSAVAGNSDINARRGTADGTASGTGTSGGSGSGGAPGNAAVTNYPGQVMQRIQRTRQARVAGRGTAVVSFTVGANGQLAGVQIQRSSGSGVIDAAALEHVRRASPFPAPPAGAGRNFSFEFVVR